jgi:uncharacterized protein YhhL (DUF1145 family)
MRPSQGGNDAVTDARRGGRKLWESVATPGMMALGIVSAVMVWGIVLFLLLPDRGSLRVAVLILFAVSITLVLLLGLVVLSQRRKQKGSQARTD